MSSLKFEVGDTFNATLTVKEVDEKDTVYPYCVRVEGSEHWFWVSENDLTTAQQRSNNIRSKVQNIEVGDIIVKSSGGSGIYQVDKDDMAHGLIDMEDVCKVYKLTWERPPSLEEMSREELIARIKQLEGEK